MSQTPRTDKRLHQSPRRPFSRRVNDLRVAAADWLMPAEHNGYDGSLEPCSRHEMRHPPLSAAPERQPEKNELVRAEPDESEVIWLTRLVAVVASGVLTMMIWLFTPLGW